METFTLTLGRVSGCFVHRCPSVHLYMWGGYWGVAANDAYLETFTLGVCIEACKPAVPV